jgi:SAM-dependent methyltransferase
MTNVARPYHEWHEKRVATSLAHLAGHLPPGRPLRCLDLGHDPKMGPRLGALGLAVTGNVYPGTAVPEASWEFAEFDLELGFPLPDSHFDVVTAFEVIEHVVSTPRRLLGESRRVLKRGGLLYLTTPNVCAWAKVRRMLSQVHPYDAGAYSMDFQERHHMCHVYEYDPWTLQQVVQSEGFEIVECATWDTFASDPAGMRNAMLRGLVTASLAVTGHVKDAAQLWRKRGHSIGLVARRH